MGVKFELKTPPGQKPDGSPLDPVEYVEIEVSPSEVVSRVATDEDRNKHKSAYAAFRAGEETRNTETGTENPGPVYWPEPNGSDLPVSTSPEPPPEERSQDESPKE